jgi:transposase
MRRGRRPGGVKCVDQLDGSAQAKQRLKVVLANLTGTCSVEDACAELGVSAPRFYQLREQALTASLERLEPRQAGRRRRQPTAEQQQVADLQQQLADQDVELRAAQARAEIAVTLPRLVHEPPAAEKKTTHRPQSARRRTSGTRPPT